MNKRPDDDEARESGECAEDGERPVQLLVWWREEGLPALHARSRISTGDWASDARHGKISHEVEDKFGEALTLFEEARRDVRALGFSIKRLGSAKESTRWRLTYKHRLTCMELSCAVFWAVSIVLLAAYVYYHYWRR